MDKAERESLEKIVLEIRQILDPSNKKLWRTQGRGKKCEACDRRKIRNWLSEGVSHEEISKRLHGKFSAASIGRMAKDRGYFDRNV